MPSELRERAAGREVATGDRGDKLRHDIAQMEQQFQLAMPRGVEARQLVRDAMTVLRNNPRLIEVDPRTLLGALMTCAQLGLRPAVLGQAYIIPFKGKAQLVIGYLGYKDLAQRSGDISSISMRIRRANDAFEMQWGLEEYLRHQPADGERGEAIGYYAVVRTRSGGTYWEYMPLADVEAHRDRFAMARDRSGNVIGPWVEHFNAMALKTVLLKTLKLAPRSTEVVTAMAVDESFRVDLAPEAELLDASWREADEIEGGEGGVERPAAEGPLPG